MSNKTYTVLVTLEYEARVEAENEEQAESLGFKEAYEEGGCKFDYVAALAIEDYSHE